MQSNAREPLPALTMVKPGIRLRTIGAAIQKFVEAEGFSVVREYCGHGIGRVFHEEPQVLHYDADDGGVVLQKGMTFTIEPMVNAGDYRIRTMKDGWTVKPKTEACLPSTSILLWLQTTAAKL